MFFALWQRIKNIDWLIFSAIFFLAFIGLILIYSISINPISPNAEIFRKQLIFTAVGIGFFFFISTVNYRFWMTYSKIVYIICGLALLYVVILGVPIRGTSGWISLGFIRFQPVEFAKIGLIIYLAKYFSDYGRHFFLWRHIIVSGIAMFVYMGLVLMQPDFGSGIVIFGTWFLMLLIVGVPKKHLMILISTFLVIAAVAWIGVLRPYQKDRIITFLNPKSDVLGVGYNVRQSIIAVGSGRIFGRGFGLGSQSQLKFLPEPETDFIFAVLGEEYGLVGVGALFAGLLILMYRLLLIANKTRDNFAAFFSLGLVSLLTVQTFINIGMNIGIAPVTGIPLPFISAGGSSLLAFFIAFAIVSSIVSDTRSSIAYDKY